MRKKKYACVLDIGSSKITALIGERGINNTFNIFGTGETQYAGFYKGEFLEPEKLPEIIQSSIEKAQNNSGIVVEKIYVGVPAEFSYCKTNFASISFKKRMKITSKEIYEFLDLVSKDVDTENNVILNRSPIFFNLDDNRKCMNQNGQVSSKLAGEICFVFSQKSFIEDINKILFDIGLGNVEYISSPLAEAIYLLEPEVRDTGAILIDVGYITTSIALVKGDGMLGLNSFSLGGGHLTADLSEVLKISFKDAENLKRKIVLSLDASNDDLYDIVMNNGNARSFEAKLTNDIVKARMDMIATLISKSLIVLKNTYNGYLPIYLTGGGISYLKGGKDYLSKAIGANIEVLSPKVPQLNRPHFSSVLGILDLALSQNETKKLSLKDKLKKFFSK